MKHLTRVLSDTTKLCITIGDSGAYAVTPTNISAVHIYAIDYSHFIYELDSIMRYVAQFITARTTKVKFVGMHVRGYTACLLAAYLAQLFKTVQFDVLMIDAPVKLEDTVGFTTAYPGFKKYVTNIGVWAILQKYSNLTSILTPAMTNLTIRYVYTGKLTNPIHDICDDQHTLLMPYSFTATDKLDETICSNTIYDKVCTDKIFIKEYKANWDSFFAS